MATKEREIARITLLACAGRITVDAAMKRLRA